MTKLTFCLYAFHIISTHFHQKTETKVDMVLGISQVTVNQKTMPCAILDVSLRFHFSNSCSAIPRVNPRSGTSSVSAGIMIPCECAAIPVTALRLRRSTLAAIGAVPVGNTSRRLWVRRWNTRRWTCASGFMPRTCLNGAQGHIQRTAIKGIGRYAEHGLVYVAQAALLEPRLHLRARSK